MLISALSKIKSKKMPNTNLHGICELSYLLHRRRLDGGGRGPGRDQPRPGAAAADGRLLLALQAVPHRAGAHEAQALPEGID